MTKERKIAIELWQAMRELVSKGEITDTWAMFKAKRKWLAEHNINWYCECWFCHYFRRDIEDMEDEDEDEDIEHLGKTSKCPLNHYHPSRCSGCCIQYGIAGSDTYSMERRLAAVDNIIKALKGEYKE